MTAGERVNGSRTFGLIPRCPGTLTWLRFGIVRTALAGQALMDDIEGILVVISLCVDGG